MIDASDVKGELTSSMQRLASMPAILFLVIGSPDIVSIRLDDKPSHHYLRHRQYHPAHS
mgnify:CR=1 FL=1